MKNLLLIALVAGFALSCGEAGVGFNAGKEFPVSVPFDLPAGNTPEFLGTVNPPPITRSENYSLEGAGFDDLDNLDEVEVVALAYEITGVNTTTEAVNLDEIEIALSTLSGSNIATISITSNQLSDIAKTDISDPAGLAALKSALDNKEDIVVDIVFDFQETPTNDINFEFVLYFDVIAKIRNL